MRLRLTAVRCLIVLGLLAASSRASAGADVSLSGNLSWATHGSTIDIEAGTVTNNSSGGISGTLQLEIWATSTPYSGGTIHGYVLGTRNLGQLQGGFSFTGISGDVPFTAPPAGTYYTTMTLEQYNGSAFVIADYSTFPGTSTFTGGGGGGGSSLSLGGSVGWSLSGGKLSITAETIDNSGGGTSGSLQLELWATNSPYAGGTIQGYSLGIRSLKPLRAGFHYANVKGAVPFSPPPPGEYYTTLALEEFTSSGYVIVDYVTFDSTSVFGLGNGGIGGGGGGSGTGVQFVNKVAYKITPKKGVVDLKLNEVLNDRFSGVTGTLRVQLWATAAPYAGGTLNGYVMTTRSLGQLAAGYYYQKITSRTSYFPPPPGTYRVVLTLEEYVSGQYVIVDWVNFNSKLKVK
jgi:hypothetical protein